jgi:hypothetical protein
VVCACVRAYVWDSLKRQIGYGGITHVLSSIPLQCNLEFCVCVLVCNTRPPLQRCWLVVPGNHRLHSTTWNEWKLVPSCLVTAFYLSIQFELVLLLYLLLLLFLRPLRVLKNGFSWCLYHPEKVLCVSVDVDFQNTGSSGPCFTSTGIAGFDFIIITQQLRGRAKVPSLHGCQARFCLLRNNHA